MPTGLADINLEKERRFVGRFQLPLLFPEEVKKALPKLKEEADWFLCHPRWEEETQVRGVPINYAERLISFYLTSWFLYHPRWEEETQVCGVPINYEEFESFIKVGTLLRKEMGPREFEQEALLNIATEFSKVEKVKSIYVDRYREELQIQVLLSISQYDSNLMDILLEIEYDIRKRYPEIIFEFFYPPAGISESEDFIHPKAECIYSR